MITAPGGTVDDAATGTTSCELYVDPVCPYAWIASRWIQEVATRRPVAVDLHVMSIAVLNEHRELEPGYRDFNERSWLPARVAAAAEANGTFPNFYAAFGRRVHLDGRPDWNHVSVEALRELGLPDTLIDDAVADPRTLEMLRERQTSLNEVVGTDTGTPTLIINGSAYFGPVLRAVPRGDAAAALYDAICALAQIPSFTELRRGDNQPLDRR